jgi:hypothetical protein
LLGNRYEWLQSKCLERMNHPLFSHAMHCCIYDIQWALLVWFSVASIYATENLTCDNNIFLWYLWNNVWSHPQLGHATDLSSIELFAVSECASWTKQQPWTSIFHGSKFSVMHFAIPESCGDTILRYWAHPFSIDAYLSSIRPIHFVSIVIFGIVRSSNHHACSCFLQKHCIRLYTSLRTLPGSGKRTTIGVAASLENSWTTTPREMKVAAVKSANILELWRPSYPTTIPFVLKSYCSLSIMKEQ